MDNQEQPGESLDSDLPNTADSDQHDEPNPADAELDGDDTDGGDPLEEEDEIEVDGRKFVLPKTAAEKIRAGMMKDADYTQKTQAVAAERQAIAAERAAVERQRETHQQFIKDIAKVEAINDQLAQYENVDWNALRQNDLDAYLQHQENRRALEAQRNTAANELTQKQQQFALNEQQALAKQVQDADAYVQREIPGWSEERQNQVSQYMQSQGVQMNPVLARAIVQSPALLKLAHKAELFDRLEKKQTAKQPAPPVPPPATRVSAARQGAKKDPARMSDAEWYASRKQTRK
ncbi:hypothetical protein OU994_18065 [Pseudoduganella sp. SL102]|uniref:hypothetical protein n=1 Tax=Pseudoduganella sp. SL102 TaxID=2995154 RepID=UPI00248C8457|nr:hypothetical protein [Pseudoduganella sp. SL102]WBS00227.1 hypothetical protein OU994_18065 [Pseudoduganella sp. SL102]